MKRFAAMLVLMLPALAGAQINKCLDAGGKVVAYGTECPPGTRAQQTTIRNAPAPSASAAQKSTAERDAEFRKRRIEQQEATAKAQKQSAESEQRKRACDDSRAYLKSLQERQRITRTDPKTGERGFLSDADYPVETAKAQQAVNANCK